jgi:hypothetical protein
MSQSGGTYLDAFLFGVRLVYVNGVLQPVEGGVNLIPGTNVTLSVADNPSQNRTDITINSTGGSGSSGMFTTLTIVNDGGSTSVGSDNSPLIDCSPTSSAGCLVSLPSSPVDKQSVTVKTGDSTTATNKTTVSGNGHNIEQPMAPGTYSSSATLVQAGEVGNWYWSSVRNAWRFF